jgi:hypothetical protein
MASRQRRRFFMGQLIDGHEDVRVGLFALCAIVSPPRLRLESGGFSPGPLRHDSRSPLGSDERPET